jgi:hypothetical protein
VLAVALMDRVKTCLADPRGSLSARGDMPTLHPDPIQRLRRSIFNTTLDHRNGEAANDRKTLSKYNRVDSVTARNQNGRFVDLNCWPTPNDWAAA